MQKYLTEEQHAVFNAFLRKRKVKKIRIANILGLKSSASITDYFKRKVFRYSDFIRVRELLRIEANEDFRTLDSFDDESKFLKAIMHQ